MADKAKNLDSPKKANEEKENKKPEEQKYHEIYTHGKIFKVPIEKSLAEFLKEKYPDEHK